MSARKPPPAGPRKTTVKQHERQLPPWIKDAAKPKPKRTLAERFRGLGK